MLTRAPASIRQLLGAIPASDAFVALAFWLTLLFPLMLKLL